MLAQQIATALERVRLLARLRRQVADLTAIGRISQALAANTDPDALIDLVGDTLRDTFRAQNVYVALYDRDTGLIHFPYDVDNGVRQTSPPIPLGEGLTSQVIATRRPLLLNAGVDRHREQSGTALFGTAAKSLVTVPIVKGDDVIGAISVQSTEREGIFDDDDVRLLTTIAGNVGVAIENARLYAAAVREKTYLEAIVQNGPVAILTSGRDGVLWTWNPAAEELFGYNAEEAVGRDINDLIAGSDDLKDEAQDDLETGGRGRVDPRHRPPSPQGWLTGRCRAFCCADSH